MRRLSGIVLAVTLLAASCPAVRAGLAWQAGTRSEDSVKTLALQWFAQMEAGQIDRTQLTPRVQCPVDG